MDFFRLSGAAFALVILSVFGRGVSGLGTGALVAYIGLRVQGVDKEI